MDQSTPIRQNHQFDTLAFQTYLEQNIQFPQSTGIFVIRQFANGQSNPSFYINYKGLELVMRKKPHGKLLQGAHDIQREFQFISALYKVQFPVPKPYHFCNNTSIIGTEFYLMEFVQGRIFRDLRLPELSPEERFIVFSEMIKTLAQLHKYKPEELGLQQFQSKTSQSYFTRQITAWTRNYKQAETQPISEMDKLITWLPQNMPTGEFANTNCIAHGDYRLDNIIFDNQSLKVKAVLDWELCTIGSPIADIAYNSLTYYFPTYHMGLGMIDAGFHGIPTVEEVKQIYSIEMGLGVSQKAWTQKEWYFVLALAAFRMSAIGQGVYKRSLQGNASNPEAHMYHKMAVMTSKVGYKFVEKAEETIESRIQKLKKEPKYQFLGEQKLKDKFWNLLIKLQDFMESEIYPNEKKFLHEINSIQGKARWQHHSKIVSSLQEKAKAEGLWNLFLPPVSGISNLEYAILCEIMGRSFFFAPTVFNCQAPDTGNMEILHKYGTEEQKKQYLQPLLDYKIRSAFAMTSKKVGSSDATNLDETIIPNDNGTYTVNGRKWYISGAGDPLCTFSIFMGRTPNPNKSRHEQFSMIIVPMNTPGVTIIRPMGVFGYDDAPHGHMDIQFSNVIVSKDNILGGEGKGFEIAQGRLGPGRIHHCMRLIGMAERAYEAMCDRVKYRKVFGKRLELNDSVMITIAKCRIEIEQTRLLLLKTAYMMDTVGAKNARTEIAMIKVSAAKTALMVIDNAIQLFGAEGVSQDIFLSYAYATARTLRIADGPDEVHLTSIAKGELTRLTFRL